jgi:hypothetical protein
MRSRFKDIVLFISLSLKGVVDFSPPLSSVFSVGAHLFDSGNRATRFSFAGAKREFVTVWGISGSMKREELREEIWNHWYSRRFSWIYFVDRL